jgi:glycogen debranching enzyme
MHSQAKASFLNRFGADGATPDVIDGPAGDDHAVRPNQFLAHSLPFGPRRGTAIGADASALLTALGPRSLAVGDQAYVGRHRGSSAERDRAYHQGTVWPWLIGSYVEAERSAGRLPLGVLEGLNAHLSEHGLGSVSETADADAPHEATGCPFQAWSVAELLRAHTLLAQ